MRARASLPIALAAVLLGIGLRQGIPSSADSSPAPNLPFYTWKELSLPDGAKSLSVRKMGADGTIFGGAIFPDNTEKPCCWRGGVFIPAPLLAGYTSGEVMDGNVHGDKVGYQFRPGGPPQAVEWLAVDNMPRLLDAPDVYSSANAINESGVIVGGHQVAGNYTAFFINPAGKTQDLVIAPTVTFSDAQAINRYDLIAGISLDSSYLQQIFLTSLLDGLMSPITPPAPFTQGALAGLNDQGQMAGTWMSAKLLDPTIAFLYDSITRKADVLPTPAGYNSGATGMNNKDDVVGFIQKQGAADKDAVLWKYQSGVIILQSLLDPQSGVTVRRALGISDAGEIAVLADIAGKPALGTLLPPP